MSNLIRVKYLQQCENSAVSVRILPPEAGLSTLNLSYFFGLLIKVCSDFFSKVHRSFSFDENQFTDKSNVSFSNLMQFYEESHKNGIQF